MHMENVKTQNPIVPPKSPPDLLELKTPVFLFSVMSFCMALLQEEKLVPSAPVEIRYFCFRIPPKEIKQCGGISLIPGNPPCMADFPTCKKTDFRKNAVETEKNKEFRRMDFGIQALRK